MLFYFFWWNFKFIDLSKECYVQMLNAVKMASVQNMLYYYMWTSKTCIIYKKELNSFYR